MYSLRVTAWRAARCCMLLGVTIISWCVFIKQCYGHGAFRVQGVCESRGGRPGLSVLMSLTVSVDVKQHWTILRHWWQFVPNLSTDIRGHEALHHLHYGACECSWSVPAVHRRSPVRPLRIVLLCFSLGFHWRTLLQAGQLSGTPVATLRGSILGKTSSVEWRQHCCQGDGELNAEGSRFHWSQHPVQ